MQNIKSIYKNQLYFYITITNCQKEKEIKSVGKDVKKRNNCAVCGNLNWCGHCGKQYGDSSKIKNRTSIRSSNCTSGYLFKVNKITNSKRYPYPHVNCSVTYSGQDRKITYVSINRGVDKENRFKYTHTHTHNGILFVKITVIKKNPAICRNLDFEGIMLSEVSQTEKDKHFMILLICGI